MLDATGLCKRYGDRTVVDDLSLHVSAGEIVGLLGPNGAGKSTTVGMLCGIVEPDAGRTVIGRGDDKADLSTHPADAKRRIGIVPQELSIYENLPARANLELFAALYGLRGRELAAKVDAALALVGLSDRAGDNPSAFSGGMKRRLNIACSLVHDPDVLILDEPTVGVDPQSRNAIFDNLEVLRDRGKALLYTTHYMEEAERLCDRIVIVDHGRVVASDTVAGLARRLPTTQILEIEVDGEVRLAALAALPGVEGPERDGDVVRMRLDDLGRDAPALLAAIAAGGARVVRIASEGAGLEDVFLALTGRALRD